MKLTEEELGKVKARLLERVEHGEDAVPAARLLLEMDAQALMRKNSEMLREHLLMPQQRPVFYPLPGDEGTGGAPVQ